MDASPQPAAAGARAAPGSPLAWLLGEWQWPYAGALVACFLVALLPIVWSGLGLAAALVYAQLPAYLLHQLEEHAGERFRLYADRSLGEGVLGRGAIFAINVLAVWVPILVAFQLAYYVDPGWGLVAVYLTGVNALTHVAVAVRSRGYNPGLGTAALLFLPLSIWAALEVEAAYAVPAAIQLVALAAAIGGHVAIVAYALRRRRALARPA